LIIWLHNYFIGFGDVAPNKDEVMLAINSKAESYEAYKKEFKVTDQTVLDYTTFIDIWNGLFPNYIQRPWVSIPGKCDTCYIIDKMRKEAESSIVVKLLNEAHLLHRGGMFMLERHE
jgi:hypothetical protein